MAIHKKKQNLWLIDLDQNLEGFHHFISCWVYSTGECTILVDPGPTATIPLVKKALKELGIVKLDYILLTHIHIDHAGGTGLLLDDFPDVQVICHPRGIEHMINPNKLWQGSLSVLGKIAEVYGSISSIPEKRISYQQQINFKDRKIEVIETPGHALHHLNYLVDGILFAGEVAGVTVPADEFYLRIATPPKFIYKVYKTSLFKAAMLDCDMMCFGHYGLNTETIKVFDSAKNQLELWMEISSARFSKNRSVNSEEIFNDLVEKDILLKPFTTLPKDIQKREKYFTTNSIKGMLGYIGSNN